MTALDILQKQIASGQDSSRQFKADVPHAESLASEMAAFANSEGGTLFTGMADDGSWTGQQEANRSILIKRASCKMNIYSDRLKITCAASSW